MAEDAVVKARRLIEQGRVSRDETHQNIWWVDSPNSPDRRYRVQSDWNPETKDLTWITCTCPHGLHVGAGDTRCYHAAAVLLLLNREKEEAHG